ncbi:MAG: hypothetical protein WDZ30_02100 [Cellvibrionaceae bacterium]
MSGLLSILNAEFQKKPWNSILQLALGGMALYVFTITAGPAYGCGPDNTQLVHGVFICARGELQDSYKVLMLVGIVLASLCWGRAASLYEKRRRSTN